MESEVDHPICMAGSLEAHAKVQRAHLCNASELSIDSTRVDCAKECHLSYITPETRFGLIADLAARLFNVPIALICLKEGDTVYVKHGSAMLPPFLDLEGSLCSYTSVSTHASACVVEDATRDARFANHQL